MNKIVAFFITAILLVSFVGFCQEVSDSLDRAVPGIVKVLKDLQATMYPPEVNKVKVEPEKPKADEDIAVTAEIYNDWNVTDDETMEAYLNYSINGGKTWEEVEMEQDENDEKKWIGTIPGQDSGTEIIYYLRAGDSSGNYFTELPCKVTNIPPTEEKPETCLFKIAPDDTPIDDETELVPDDLDVQEGSVGYNDENIYIKMKVQGKISQGSANPMKIHGYAAVLLNPDKGTVSNILTQLVGIVYGPLAKMGGYDPCLSLYTRNGKDIVVGQEGVKCEPAGSDLYLTISKTLVGDNPSGKLKVVGGITATVMSFSSEPYGQLGDFMRLNTVQASSRVIKVE